MLPVFVEDYYQRYQGCNIPEVGVSPTNPDGCLSEEITCMHVVEVW